MSSSVEVPDVISLPYSQAFRVCTGAGLRVRGVTTDGQSVADDSERVVVDQEPEAGEVLKTGRTLLLRVGRGPGGMGKRVPEAPDPLGEPGYGELPGLFTPDRSRGSREDADLVPS